MSAPRGTEGARSRLARASRGSIVAAALGSLALLLVDPVPSVAQTPSRARPNFVLVVTDDQRWDTIGRCRGGFDATDLEAGEDACMPELQRLLIARGTTFFRAYVTTALCCPSRVSLLTGRYARHTGVIDNHGLPAFDDGSTLATWLEAAGYRTALIGKYLNGYGETPGAVPEAYVPPGWTSWHAFWGRPGYAAYSLVERDPRGTATIVRIEEADAPSEPCGSSATYSTDLLCRRAIEFIEGSRDPFFLLFAPFAPHLPAVGAARHRGEYPDVFLPEYPNHDVLPTPNPPPWLPTQPLSTRATTANASAFRAALTANRAVDDAIAAVHRTLADRGELDRTVWIFLSDNGLALGEHRWDSKACPYEECHRVPLVVACPAAVCPDAVGGRVDPEHFALNIDVAPTIVDLSGVRAPGRMDGRSLVPLLGGPPPGWRESFFLEDHGVLGPLGGPIAVISREDDGHVYKLVTYTEAPSRTELYDLTSDPWELTNLAEDPAHAVLRSSLTAELARTWDLRTGASLTAVVGFLVVGSLAGALARIAGRGGDPTSIRRAIVLGSLAGVLGGWVSAEVVWPDGGALPWIAAIASAIAAVVLLRIERRGVAEPPPMR
jgi:arylsulfatase A-like enzyme